jgi:hypothetical protein
MKDPIIQELWKIKDGIAKECGNNIDKLAGMLKAKEKSRRSAASAKARKTNRKIA